MTWKYGCTGTNVVLAHNAKTADSSVLRILAVDRYRHVLGCGTPHPILPKCADGGYFFIN